MKSAWILCVILSCCVFAFAAGNSLRDPLRLASPQVEIAELEALISSAKDSGQIPDPAWSARIRELVPLVKGHPANLRFSETTPLDNHGFGPSEVVRPQESSALEQQIRDLEFQLSGGISSQAPDPVTFANLKEQLNELYEQRPENRRRNPLDQGTDACPALTMIGAPISFNGTTTGYANNYAPLTPCNPTNAPDVIYQFTPSFSGTFAISLAGSSYDTYLYVNTGGACAGTTQVGCNDDYFGLQSFLQLALNGGQTYYIIVDGYQAHAGNYHISLTDICEVPCQPGDAFECFDEGPDTTNAIYDCDGACNNISGGGVATWGEILPCQPVCGRGFTYRNATGGDSRDTDFYRFTLADACSLSITIESEFPTRLLVRTNNGTCPSGATLFLQDWFSPCSTATFITPCFQPGNYELFVAPTVFTGILDYREYRVQMDLIPCNGCRIDDGLVAPGSKSWNTCFAGNDCGLRPSTDYTYCVAIPYASDWTFSICNDDSIWDSYLYLMNTCCGSVIAQDDDACGGVGLSVIRCVPLLRGTYYLTVEGYAESGCGPFVLNVTECIGSCCYGNSGSPSCSFITKTDCDSLSGLFTEQEPCSSGACYSRPQCSAEAMISQQPYLPDESWNGYTSDLDNGVRQRDNYSVSEPVGAIRFWGFPVTCGGVPENFQIIFSSAPDTCLYTVTTTGTQLTPLYGGVYQLSEYYVPLSPPCEILSGNVSVAQFDAPGCFFYWSVSPLGDGVFPSGLGDFAFCLGSACQKIDSVTMKWEGPSADQFRMDWWMPQAGFVRVYSTLNASDVFPAGYTVLASGSVPAGHFTFTPMITDPLRIFVLTVECGVSAVQEPDENSPFRRIE